MGSLFQGFFILCLSICTAMPRAEADVVKVTPQVSVVQDGVNGVLIERDGRVLCIYGDPREIPGQTDAVLFTHHRRDAAWAGIEAVKRGASAYAPAGEVSYFTQTDEFWNEYTRKRFHDYAQQSSKIPTESIQDCNPVQEGDSIDWNGLEIRVLSTPGYTRGAVSYLFEIDDRTIACVGDLMYGDGRIFDLYSLQDAIPEAKIGGYHGYAARIADTIASLRKLSAENPDMIIPVRGPVIDNPRESIETLILRLQAVYRNYLSINALRWYFGDGHIEACAARVLDSTAVAWMPMAETVQPDPPEWIIPIQNARLIVSQNKSGFLIDCGRGILPKVNELIASGRVEKVDGVYITHYHDDHTDEAQKAADTLGCPVYFCKEQRDLLEHPAAYRMPAQTDQPIRSGRAMEEGETLRWNEFLFTFSYYPGQTLYHGGLLARHDNGDTIFFVGDSFTPSGIDDYCLLNRNLLHPGRGYFYCLERLRELPPHALLINQHVHEPFRYSDGQIQFMLQTLKQRHDLLANLFPFDDPNYGLDEQWARLYPYGQTVRAAANASIHVRLMSHAPAPTTYRGFVRFPSGWRVEAIPFELTADRSREVSLEIPFTIPKVKPGVYVITADIEFDGFEMHHWMEAMVEVVE